MKTFTGNVTATANADLNQLANVTDISGSLSISGTVTNLMPLTCLTRVTGNITVNGASALADFSLSRLTTVGGRVAIHLKDKVLEVVNPGGTFGEMALVDNSPRVASATADQYSELLTVDRNSLLDAVKSQPAFAMAMLKAVVERLRHMNAQLG